MVNEENEDSIPQTIFEVRAITEVALVLGGVLLAFIAHYLWEMTSISLFAAEFPLFCYIAGNWLKKLTVEAENERGDREMSYAHTAFEVIAVSFLAGIVAILLPMMYAWMAIFVLVCPLGFILLPAYDRWEKAKNEGREKWLLEQPVDWNEKAFDDQLDRNTHESFMADLVTPQRR